MFLKDKSLWQVFDKQKHLWLQIAVWVVAPENVPKRFGAFFEDWIFEDESIYVLTFRRPKEGKCGIFYRTSPLTGPKLHF